MIRDSVAYTGDKSIQDLPGSGGIAGCRAAGCDGARSMFNAGLGQTSDDDERWIACIATTAPACRTASAADLLPMRTGVLS